MARKANGFTIVELLIVIIVIGILAALVLVAYSNVTNQAKVTVVKADLTQAAKQLALDRERGGGSSFPTSLSAANSGNGISPSSGATYSYVPANTTAPNSYCLQETLGSVNYFVTGTNGNYTTPAVGGCTVTSGLVGWWPFNGNANDASGNGLNGTVTSATLTTGQNGAANGAYSFNGSSANINFGNQTAFNTPNVTLSAWVNQATASGTQTIMAKELQYKYRISSGNSVGVLQSDNGTAWAGNYGYSYTFSTGTWYNVALTIDSTSRVMQTYVNGVQVGSNGSNSMTGYNTNSLFVGAYNGNGEPFNGSIDDARIYNRVLSASEIMANYTAGAQ